MKHELYLDSVFKSINNQTVNHFPYINDITRSTKAYTERAVLLRNENNAFQFRNIETTSKLAFSEIKLNFFSVH